VYAAHRAAAVRAILQTAKEARDDAVSQRNAIESLQLGLGNYETTLQRARDLATLDRRSAMASFQSAATLMDTQLQPAAEALDHIALQRMRESLATETGRSGTERAALALGVAVLGMTLVLVQISLAYRTRRLLNLPLLGASLLTLVFGLHALAATGDLQGGLTAATGGIFGTGHNLELAHVAGARAAAEGSRAGLAPERDSNHAQERFASSADLVATIPASLTGEELVDALRDGRQVPEFRGYLADSVNQTSRREEREAELRTLTAWNAFRQAAEAPGALAGRPGKIAGPEVSFPAFETAVEEATALAQRRFSEAVQTSSHALGVLQVQGMIATLLSTLLVFAGFAPRIREYRA
jgi:hypothetical protein